MTNDILPLLSVLTFGIGLIALMIGSIWFYVEAFKESPLWFLACLVFPFASILFLFKYADRVIIPTGIIFIGAFFTIVGSMIA